MGPNDDSPTAAMNTLLGEFFAIPLIDRPILSEWLADNAELIDQTQFIDAAMAGTESISEERRVERAFEASLEAFIKVLQTSSGVSLIVHNLHDEDLEGVLETIQAISRDTITLGYEDGEMYLEVDSRTSFAAILELGDGSDKKISDSVDCVLVIDGDLHSGSIESELMHLLSDNNIAQVIEVVTPNGAAEMAKRAAEDDEYFSDAVCSDLMQTLVSGGAKTEHWPLNPQHDLSGMKTIDLDEEDLEEVEVDPTAFQNSVDALMEAGGLNFIPGDYVYADGLLTYCDEENGEEIQIRDDGESFSVHMSVGVKPTNKDLLDSRMDDFRQHQVWESGRNLFSSSGVLCERPEPDLVRVHIPMPGAVNYDSVLVKHRFASNRLAFLITPNGTPGEVYLKHSHSLPVGIDLPELPHGYEPYCAGFSYSVRGGLVVVDCRVGIQKVYG